MTQFAAQGGFVSYVIPANEHGNEHELRVVATGTGQVTFARNVGRHVFSRFVPEGLLVYGDTDIQLLRPQDGAVLGGYPKP